VKRKRVFATLKVLGSVLGQLTDELPEAVSIVFSNIILLMTAHALILQLLILWTISGLF
jgi:hypothetical protein